MLLSGSHSRKEPLYVFCRHTHSWPHRINYCFVYPPLTALSIKALSFYPLLYDQETMEEEYSNFRAPLRSLLEGLRGSLTQLTISSQALWESPIHILQGLEQLSIYSATNLSNITLLLHHCARLKCLSIHIDPDLAAAPELYDVLAAHPTAWPNLTRFKLHTAESLVTYGAVETLAKFVGEKKKLRCLDYSNHCHSVAELQPLLSVLRSLPCLEVLGLDLPYEAMAPELHQHLKHAFPEALTALRLNFKYDDGEDIELEDFSLARNPHCSTRSRLTFASQWASLPKLAFAHVSDSGDNPLVSDLVSHAERLQLVGHSFRYHDVRHLDDEFELGLCWSGTKVQFPTVDDFGDADWMWLMEGHTLFDVFTYH